jgi:hypothetical protein
VHRPPAPGIKDVARKDALLSGYHNPHRATEPLSPALALLLVALIPVALIGVGAMFVTSPVIVLVALGTLVVVAGTVWFGVIHRPQGRRAIGQEQPVPMAAVGWARPGARTQPVSDWRATRARFAQLRSEYGQFECDPLAVLRLPAMIDVTVPSTGRFVEAFAEAQALDTDTEPPESHCARFATAVDQVWRAWRAARDAAQRIRFAGIPAQELATVQRAIKLLTVARDSDHDAERTAAYAKARAELAKLDRSGTLRLPPAAAAALDVAARGQLPAGSLTDRSVPVIPIYRYVSRKLRRKPPSKSAKFDGEGWCQRARVVVEAEFGVGHHGHCNSGNSGRDGGDELHGSGGGGT